MEYQYTYNENCWFKENCPRETKIGCDASCPIRSEFDYLINTSNIPNEFRKKITLYPEREDLDAFHTLKDIQLDIELFTEQGRTLYLWSKSVGTGKAQPLYSKLLTPNGYINMGEVKIGDEVFGEDGKPHKVIGVFPQGKKDVYEITFSDGSKCRCSDEHLWAVRTPNKTTHIKTLKELIDKGLSNKTYCKKDNNYYNSWKFYVPITQPLKFIQNSKLPLDAWLFGVLLGDGGLTSNRSPVITNTESDIIDKLSILLLDIGCKLVHSSKSSYRIVDISNDNVETLNINNKNSNRLTNILRELNVWGHKSETKFIPKQYLFASVDDRLKLLQGLIDTDGTLSKAGALTYSTSSKQLAEDVIFLVQSLGGTCSCNERETFYTYKGERKQGLNSFELYIKMDKSIMPFTSKKHLAKYKVRQANPYRNMRKIEYIGKEECQCIMVDNPSHLYLTDNMIVTHNTSWVTKIMNTYLAVMCYGNGYKDLAWFEYAPSFVLMAKEFKNNERLEHIKNLSDRPLCIIDDIGAVNPSNYDMSVLSSIIDTRYSKGLATLYTSNISPDNLELLLGARNADRILSDIVIELQGTGRRGSTSEYKRKE